MGGLEANKLCLKLACRNTKSKTIPSQPHPTHHKLGLKSGRFHSRVSVVSRLASGEEACIKWCALLMTKRINWCVHILANLTKEISVWSGSTWYPPPLSKVHKSTELTRFLSS